MSKTRTSRLKAIIPRRWGYRKVDIIFGRVRPSRDQVCAVAGDLIQRDGDGSIWEFKYREGDKLHGYLVRRG